MSTQLKYSFKKESAQFFRTFKFWGIVLAIFGFALANPIMYKASGILFSELNKAPAGTQTAAVQMSLADSSEAAADEGLLGGMGIVDMAAM